MTPDEIVARFSTRARANFVKLRAGMLVTGAQLNGLKLRGVVVWRERPRGWICDTAISEAFDRRWPKTADINRPRRAQLRRTAGYRLPENTVSVARPSQWGNPYVINSRRLHVDGVIHDVPDRGTAVHLYREWICHWLAQPTNSDLLSPLRGKNLACWCPPGAPCHADVLLELANE
jgi:hypothetical protein